MKCRWHQFWINRHLDDGQSLSESTRIHLQSCASCEQFYRAQVSVENQLSQRDELEVQPSPYLKQRILNQIGQEQREPTRAGALQWVGAGAVATVALAFAIMFSGSGSGELPIQNASEQSQPDWVAVTARVTSGENLFRVATNLNQPLHQELEFVIKDARAVLDTLTEEFVPSRLLASND